MRILLLGDTHGNIRHVSWAFEEAVESKADLIIQLGDFGYGWGGAPPEDGFSREVADLVTSTGIELAWLDGNHENFNRIETEITDADLERSPEGTFEYLPGLHYIPRGTLLTLAGVKVLCCGGAASVDKAYRTPGRSWWWQEMIRDEDVATCAAQGQAAGVLLSHDFPWEVTVVDRHLDPMWGSTAVAATRSNRQRISEIVRAAHVSRVYHGHLHLRYDEIIEGCWHKVSRPAGSAPWRQWLDTEPPAWPLHVTGLDCDGSGTLSWLLVETKDGTLEPTD